LIPVPSRDKTAQQRRALLEELDFARLGLAQLLATFEDGQALFDVVCDRSLEGANLAGSAEDVPLVVELCDGCAVLMVKR